MHSLDRKRPGLSPPARALAASLVRVAAHATWRTLHPAAREPFLEAQPPPPIDRLVYRAADGWEAPLLYLPPAPGGAGEPVLLAHALGVGAEAFRYGAGPTLASHLTAAGYAVYLLTHRGDAVSVPPHPRAAFTFDDVVDHDVPAALERARLHAGFPRVHWVGHGLGGQLGLAWAGRSGAEGLATLTALCAAVRFEVPRSEARRAGLAAALLPPWWHLPASTFARAALPFVGEDADLAGRVQPGATASGRLRGVLGYAAEDLPAGLLKQAARWLQSGSLVDRNGLFDYREALAAAGVPLLVVSAGGDRICPPASAAAALGTWGGEGDHLALPDGFGHLDPLLGRDAEEAVFAPIAAWLGARRRLAWERDGEICVPR